MQNGKAYNSANVRAFLKSRRMHQVVDNKKGAKGAHRKLTANDKKELKKRHVVENMFCRLKQFKRMRLRMAKWASVFEAEIQVAMCVMLLNQMGDLPVSET